jgi:aryl-alcohol dehydrogenase-like predicted oxidoreductase
MLRSVEDSLKRMKTDYVDLYYLHMWDFRTPVDEVLRAFDDLVRAGKVLYIGLSDTPAWQAARMQAIAELRGWSQFCALQISYSLTERTVEREMIPMAAGDGHGSVSVVAAWRRCVDAASTRGRIWPRPDMSDLSDPQGHQRGYRAFERSRALQISRRGRCEIARRASARLPRKSRSPGRCSIPRLRHLYWGVRTVAQLKDNLGALDVELERRSGRAP